MKNEETVPSTGVVTAPRWNSVLKFVGGKRHLVPEIRRYLPSSWITYVEPFAGGASVFFALTETPPTFHSVINDTNEKLMNMYVAVRDDVENVIRFLHEHENTKEHYYAVRSDNMSVGSKAKRAADLIFLNRAGFNGLFRVNGSGGFNVPYGDNPKALLCDEVRLRMASKQLKTATVLSTDFETITREHVKLWISASYGKTKERPLIYFDSPYIPLSKTSNFTAYGTDGFKLVDHQRLAKLTRDLIDIGVHVILSASSAPDTYELYKGLPIIEVEARRSINSNGAKRGPVKEVLVMSPWLVENANIK